MFPQIYVFRFAALALASAGVIKAQSHITLNHTLSGVTSCGDNQFAIALVQNLLPTDPGRSVVIDIDHTATLSTKAFAQGDVQGVSCGQFEGDEVIVVHCDANDEPQGISHMTALIANACVKQNPTFMQATNSNGHSDIVEVEYCCS